ncbi:MAG: hypothetical protein H7281_00020 [Bacteriovorax sp.]|nr:hypothetical protein [Bacteriovorax sp.]
MNKRDVSYKSIGMLQKRFASQLKQDVWVPDWGDSFDVENNHTVNVFIMGSYFERIFQLRFWPNQKFNMYCLSPQVKKILIEVFGFDSEVVGCLSRYQIFPKSVLLEEKYEVLKDSHLYYAGRISPQKNIEFIILTIFHIQILYSADIKLTLFGDFDNEYHKDILGCHFIDYSQKIFNLIESLPWAGEPPKFVHGLNEEEWLQEIPTKGIFLSASNLISEDFSVVAAQLQNIGRSLIIPKWGGLRDVRGENVRHYQVDLIGHSHEKIRAISQKAKKFAKSLFENIGLETLSIKGPESFFPMHSIDRDYLQQRIDLNKAKWGESIELLVQMNLPAFMATEEGQRVILNCRRCFAE